MRCIAEEDVLTVPFTHLFSLSLGAHGAPYTVIMHIIICGCVLLVSVLHTHPF